MLNYKLYMIIFKHTLCCIVIKFQRALYCKIVESDTHVNEVSLGFWQILRNPDDTCIIHKIAKMFYYCFILSFMLHYSLIISHYSGIILEY